MSVAQSLVFLVALKPEIDSGVSGGFRVCVWYFGFGFGGLHVAPEVTIDLWCKFGVPSSIVAWDFR